MCLTQCFRECVDVRGLLFDRVTKRYDKIMNASSSSILLNIRNQKELKLRKVIFINREKLSGNAERIFSFLRLKYSPLSSPCE